ncbi:MAG: twin-arginine translocase subunit TatC [Thermoplasmata archaeon]
MSQSEGLMGGKLLQYLDELLNRIRWTLVAFICIFFAMFITGPAPLKVYGIRLYYLTPSFYNSFSVLLLKYMEGNLIPRKLVLINVSPFDVIVSVVYVALSVSAAIVIPILIYQFIKFSEPGLYSRERKIVVSSIVPVILLFAAGAAFSLKLVIPLLMDVIYKFSLDLGVLPTIGIAQFISIILLVTIGMGAVFETPVVVFSLSYVGLVPVETWFRNWRYAIIAAFFTALLISPGATGGIMEVTIALIVIAFYFSGALAARFFIKRKKEKSGP